MKKDKDEQLIESVNKLTKIVDKISSRTYLEMVNNHKKFVFYNFMSGLVRGIGTAFGATIAFAFIIWLLSYIQLAPILGDWAIVILDYIQKAKGY